jgi:hypothetical protein
VDKNNKKWNSKEVQHEGFPLLLRYPETIDDLNQHSFPVLVVVTHELSEVSPNGLPKPEYNDELFNFDRDIRAALEAQGNGLTVLIETSGGKRRYYFYAADGTNVAQKLTALSLTYPNEKVSWSSHNDAKWNFIRQYAKEYFGPFRRAIINSSPSPWGRRLG